MSWNEGEAAADNWNDGGETNGFTDGDTGDAAGGFGATDGGAGDGGGGGADFTCRKQVHDHATLTCQSILMTKTDVERPATKLVNALPTLKVL